MTSSHHINVYYLRNLTSKKNISWFNSFKFVLIEISCCYFIFIFFKLNLTLIVLLRNVLNTLKNFVNFCGRYKKVKKIKGGADKQFYMQPWKGWLTKCLYLTALLPVTPTQQPLLLLGQYYFPGFTFEERARNNMSLMLPVLLD